MLGTFVGGTAYVDPSTGAQHHSFDVVDLDRDDLRRIPLDFLPHVFTTKPGARHVAAVFEKRGPGAALLDLAAMRSLGKIKARAGRLYYGHGVFSREGDQLFVVEIDRETRAGVVSVRETTGYKEVDQFPTYGESPHDCVPIDDGKVLVITNGGGAIGSKDAPSVAYVDVSSRKLLERVVFTDPKVNAGHVAVAKNGDLAVVSAPRDGLPTDGPGGIHLRAGKRKPERVRGPDAVAAKIVGESLSVCVHDEAEIVAVTNPHGGIVTFWSLRTHKLVGRHDCESPRGVEVSRDRASFVVAWGKHASVVLIDVATLAPVDRPFGDKRLAGSHVFPWDPVAA